MIPLDWIGLVTWIIATYFQFSTASTGDRRWYDLYRDKVTLAPPGWLFGIVWFILYGLMSCAIFLFWRNNAAALLYNAVLIVYLINLFLNKIWSVFFFDQGNRELSLLVMVLLNLCTAGLLVLLIVVGDSWLSFALLLPYQVWLLLAAYLNLQWFRLYLPTKMVLVSAPPEVMGPIPEGMPRRRKLPSKIKRPLATKK